MLIPIFKAKDKDSDEIVEGFYVEYPIATVQNGASSVIQPKAQCLLTYKPGMMGIVNEPYVCTIDMGTLKFDRYVDIPCSTDRILV